MSREPDQSPGQPPNQSPDQSPNQPRNPQNQSSGQSATDILSEESGKRFLKYIVGVFAAVGLGYGIGIVLFDAVADEGGELFGAIALIIPVFGAPIISMVTGLMTGLRLEADKKSAALASGVGAFLGFLVLLFLIIIFAAIAFSNGEGDSDGNLSEFIVEMGAFGIGVAVTGAATTYVVKRIEI